MPPVVGDGSIEKVDTSCNDEYYAKVIEAMNVIYSKYPDCHQADPLPLPVADKTVELTGFLAPFEPKAYTQAYLESETSGKAKKEFSHQCGINFLWQMVTGRQMPCVPILYDIVMSMLKI